MSKVNSQLEKLVSETQSTLPSLIEAGSALSTESKTVAFVSKLTNTFKSYVENITTYFNGLKLGNYPKQKIDTVDLLESIKGKDFAKTRQIYVTVPSGFIGKWVDYLNLLINVIVPSVESLEVTLKLVNKALATALNDPDRLKAQSGIRNLENGLALVTQDDFDKVKTFFTNASRTQLSLYQVVDRNADIEQAYILLNKLNADVGAINFVAIQALINRLVVLVQELKKEISKEDNDQLSGLVTSQLSDLFYKLGITVTAASVLSDSTEVLTSAMMNARDDIITALK
jgi:hypothetical protein